MRSIRAAKTTSLRWRLASLGLATLVSSAIAQETEQRPPYVATPQGVVERMLALAGTGSRDFVIDLGSGDGRIVIAAARQFGARGLGVDIDPELVAASRANARGAGVGERVQFELRDVLETDLSDATVVTIYLLPWLVDRLQPKLLNELAPGARIVAHAFPMKGWKPDRVERLRVARPQDRQAGESQLFLWIVPAQVRGTWRAEGWELRMRQNYQEIEIVASINGETQVVSEARLVGRGISFAVADASVRGRVDGGTIAGTITRPSGAAAITFLRD